MRLWGLIDSCQRFTVHELPVGWANASWVETAIIDYNDGEGINGTEIMEIELEFNRAAIADVEVEIVNATEVEATREEAIEYLKEWWEVLYPSVEPVANPTPERNNPPK